MPIMIALLSLSIWLYLFLAHGRFWSSEPELAPAAPAECPDVDVVVPARDEAQTIGPVIASLLAQDYAGKFRIFLVDDDSADETALRAGSAPNLYVIRGAPKPAGWSGKLWALQQGVAASAASVLFFTDADIVHDPRHLSTLVARLSEPGVAMVSEMVRLNCTSLAERALVPAFVYFFQMLYPFARVNDPRSRVAAAAGGTIMIRSEALERIGGIAAIKNALIDDVALAKAVKAGGPIYLGHSGLAASIRRLSPIRRHLAHDLAHGVHSTTLLRAAAFAHPARFDAGVAGAGRGRDLRSWLGGGMRTCRLRARRHDLHADPRPLPMQPALVARVTADRALLHGRDPGIGSEAIGAAPGRAGRIAPTDLAEGASP